MSLPPTPSGGLHLARFALLNIAALALITGASIQGWTALVFAQDITRITAVIAGLLVVGLSLCVWRFATLRAGSEDRDWHRTWLDERLRTIRVLIELCPILGVTGTVTGFMIAFLALDVTALTDVDAAAEMIVEMLQGIGVAVTTTLVGLLAGAWLLLSYRTLESYATELLLRR